MPSRLRADEAQKSRGENLAPVLPEEAVNSLGTIFKTLVTEATSVSALKFQKSAAKKRLDKKTAEFDKTKIHHEKFPSVRDFQLASKTEAEHEYEVITKKLQEKDASISQLATDAAEHLIPMLSHSGSSDKEQDSRQQKQYDELDKTCKGYEVLLRSQRALIEELEKKHLALEKEFRGAQSKQAEETTKINTRLDTDVLRQSKNHEDKLVDLAQKSKDHEYQVQGLLEKVKIHEDSVRSLKSEFTDAKGDAAKMSTIVSQQAQSIASLSSRVGDMDSVKVEVAQLRELLSNSQLKSSANTDKKISKLETDSIKQTKLITELWTSHEKFSVSCVTLDGRVNALEASLHDLVNRKTNNQSPQPSVSPGLHQQLSAHIQTLQEQFQQSTEDNANWQQSFESLLTDSIEDTIKDIVAKDSKEIKTRLDSLESRQGDTNASVEHLRTHSNDRAVDAFRKQLLNYTTVHQVNTALAPLAASNTDVQRSLEATNMSLSNLQSRVDNINTADLYSQMVAQMYETHPALQKVDTLGASLNITEGRLQDLGGTVTSLQASTQQLESKLHDQGAGASKHQQDDMVKELEGLANDYQLLSAKTRDTAKGLEDLQTENVKNKETIVKHFADIRDELENIDKKITEVQKEVKEVKEAKELTPRPQALQAPKSSSPAVSFASNQNGHRMPMATPNRQSSMTSSEKSAPANKKRKFETSTKTNGGGRTATSPPRRKQKLATRKNPIDDSDDDPDFDPDEIPQPAVSSDEE